VSGTEQLYLWINREWIKLWLKGRRVDERAAISAEGDQCHSFDATIQQLQRELMTVWTTKFSCSCKSFEDSWKVFAMCLFVSGELSLWHYQQSLLVCIFSVTISSVSNDWFAISCLWLIPTGSWEYVGNRSGINTERCDRFTELFAIFVNLILTYMSAYVFDLSFKSRKQGTLQSSDVIQY